MKMEWTCSNIIFGNVFVMLLCYINILLNCRLFLVVFNNVFMIFLRLVILKLMLFVHKLPNVHKLPVTSNPEHVMNGQVNLKFMSLLYM